MLDSPPERIRAYLTLHRPEHWMTGGAPGGDAPYSTALVPAGRPVEQRHRLLGAFTDIIVVGVPSWIEDNTIPLDMITCFVLKDSDHDFAASAPQRDGRGCPEFRGTSVAAR